MSKRYKVNEVDNQRFYMIPKSLFNNDKYKGLSLEAKVVYALLRDRMELSKKNNWIDENGDIYLLFSRLEIAEALDCSKPHIIKCFKQLIEYGLIEEKRQGLGKPNIIYVCHVEQSFKSLENSQKSTSFTSESKQCLPLDVNAVYPNDTDNNDTEYNETENTYIIPRNDDNTYIILPDDADTFIPIYKNLFKEYTSKEHMRIKRSQLPYILDCLSELREYGVTEEEFTEAVTNHFSNLPKSNNGNILAFLAAMMRYFEVHNPYSEYGNVEV